MKVRFEPPENKGLGSMAVASILSYLVRLSEKLNIAFVDVPDNRYIEELRREAERNREYIQELCQKNGMALPDDIFWNE
jgi:hypothetical protein